MVANRLGFCPKTVRSGQPRAIVVLTNADFSGATDTITEGIEKIVLPSPAVTPVNEVTRADDVRAMVAPSRWGD